MKDKIDFDVKPENVEFSFVFPGAICYSTEDPLDMIESIMDDNKIPLRDVIRRMLGHTPKIHWENILECLMENLVDE